MKMCYYFSINNYFGVEKEKKLSHNENVDLKKNGEKDRTQKKDYQNIIILCYENIL